MVRPRHDPGASPASEVVFVHTYALPPVLGAEHRVDQAEDGLQLRAALHLISQQARQQRALSAVGTRRAIRGCRGRRQRRSVCAGASSCKRWSGGAVSVRGPCTRGTVAGRQATAPSAPCARGCARSSGGLQKLSRALPDAPSSSGAGGACEDAGAGGMRARQRMRARHAACMARHAFVRPSLFPGRFAPLACASATPPPLTAGRDKQAPMCRVRGDYGIGPVDTPRDLKAWVGATAMIEQINTFGGLSRAETVGVGPAWDMHA